MHFKEAYNNFSEYNNLYHSGIISTKEMFYFSMGILTVLKVGSQHTVHIIKDVNKMYVTLTYFWMIYNFFDFFFLKSLAPSILLPRVVGSDLPGIKKKCKKYSQVSSQDKDE